MADHNCGKMPIEYQYLFSVFTKISLNFIYLENSNCIYFLISPVDHKYTLEIKWGRKPSLVITSVCIEWNICTLGSGFVKGEPRQLLILTSPVSVISKVSTSSVRLPEWRSVGWTISWCWYCSTSASTSSISTSCSVPTTVSMGQPAVSIVLSR